MDDFIPKSPTLNNYFYEENTELSNTILHETQQQHSVITELLFSKRQKKTSPTPSLTLRANKGLLHYYR